MSNVTIRIQDIDGDKIAVVSNPSFEEMIEKHAAKKGLTSAHGYALLALNTIRKASREGNPFAEIIKQEKSNATNNK